MFDSCAFYEGQRPSQLTQGKKPKQHKPPQQLNPNSPQSHLQMSSHPTYLQSSAPASPREAQPDLLQGGIFSPPTPTLTDIRTVWHFLKPSTLHSNQVFLKIFFFMDQHQQGHASSPCANKSDGCQVSREQALLFTDWTHKGIFKVSHTRSYPASVRKRTDYCFTTSETVTFCFLEEKTHTQCCYATKKAQSCPAQLKSCWLLNFHRGAHMTFQTRDRWFCKGISVNEIHSGDER